ncbi:VOC family protein [Aureitalea marina]|uniref:Glyoxalase n=1 Tax=Aureitalea marina TaxID=930804 RepID=A0A2S7KPL2_9FLAO|nr:VOC family protein [Aureitalea marina]PQB04562.1 glyoxalase [Aureitalea marina]
MEGNPINWFEIPVSNIERAKSFYDKVFEINIQMVDLDGTKMGFFPGDVSKPGATGSLIQHEQYTPSYQGTLIYLSCQDLAHELSRVEAAGGKVLQQKTRISPEHGFMGLMEDTEGNRIALHSNN